MLWDEIQAGQSGRVLVGRGGALTIGTNRATLYREWSVRHAASSRLPAATRQAPSNQARSAPCQATLIGALCLLSVINFRNAAKPADQNYAKWMGSALSGFYEEFCNFMQPFKKKKKIFYQPTQYSRYPNLESNSAFSCNEP